MLKGQADEKTKLQPKANRPADVTDHRTSKERRTRGDVGSEGGVGYRVVPHVERHSFWECVIYHVLTICPIYFSTCRKIQMLR